MNPYTLETYILSGGVDDTLLSCTTHGRLDVRRRQLADAVARFAGLFGEERPVSLYSVGGRTEIGGNHTDHNLGHVLAGAVDMDILAAAAPRGDGRVVIHSEGFAPDTVLPEQTAAPDSNSFFTSRAMIAGVIRGFLNSGFSVGGFDAYTMSSIPQGSGLSSSAAFAVMVGNILNHLYNGGAVNNVEIAKIAQFAENTFFGKPCGLMDQLACAVGGIVHIDFENPGEPAIQKIHWDPEKSGYTLCIVNTGGSHADLGEEYAAIPREMRQVAGLFDRPALRGLTMEDLLSRANEIRSFAGDRALLRAIHFVQENRRVCKEADALAAGDTDTFLHLALDSGRSSFQYLQNGYAPAAPKQQGLSVALCLTEAFLFGQDAAWRLHGGGFAGTIQVFVPALLAHDYKQYIESFFGPDACHLAAIRQAGAVCLWNGDGALQKDKNLHC